jgi:hypothetical protein
MSVRLLAISAGNNLPKKMPFALEAELNPLGRLDKLKRRTAEFIGIRNKNLAPSSIPPQLTTLPHIANHMKVTS